jgi:xylulokinase
LPKDYIRFKLTGEFATEVSDAAGMQLMDVPKRRWSSEMLETLGIPERLLASMHESPDVTGHVHAAGAKATGLLPGTPVVGGAGDNAAAAVGTGVVRAGRAFTTLGTSGVIYAVSDTVSIDPAGRVHTLCASVPGKWTVMGVVQSAGLSLRWLRDTCCQAEVEEAKKRGIDPYVVMTEKAAAMPIGAQNLLYLPYLMGERSPHADPDCRGVFFGLSAMHERGHLIRAVMEGVAYAMKECVDVFADMQVPIKEMMACGGGGRSPLWRQMLSDLYACPVSTIQADEGPALGAAILAGVGTGVYPSVEEACDRIVKIDTTLSPIPENAKAYEGYFKLYKKLYQSLKLDFKELSKLHG